MTKAEAIAIFRNLAASYRTTLQEHIIIQEAIKTLEPQPSEEAPVDKQEA